MGLTVVVNYMTVSHKGSNGLSIAFPDICKTPILGVPVPIPYPNIAMSSDLKKGSKKVKCDKKKVVLKSSEIKRSMGDEVGVQKGILSNKQMGKGKFENYSFDVKFEGKNVCRLLDPTTQNRSSLNTAAFAHLQPPKSASAPAAKLVEDACKEVEKKNEKEEKGEKKSGSADSAQILERHWTAMQGWLGEQGDNAFMIYFREGSPQTLPWIDQEHEPKPHEWLTGNTLKPSKKELYASCEAWLHANRPPKIRPKERDFDEWDFATTRQGTQTTQKPPHIKYSSASVYSVKGLEGVVISKRGGKLQGTPVLGSKKWRQPGGNVLDFSEGKGFMTGDYDIMDIIKVKAQCQRPTAGEFGLLKFGLNNAMRWPGIQHPHQASWRTELEGDKHTGEQFQVVDEIDKWLKGTSKSKQMAFDHPDSSPKGKQSLTNIANRDANKVPVKETVKADPKTGQPARHQAVIDNNLTILTAEGGMHLQDHTDYWDALVCCGCLDEDKPAQRRGEVDKPHEDAIEFKEGMGPGHHAEQTRQKGLTWKDRYG